jgi:excisionase family DNA binding protein
MAGNFSRRDLHWLQTTTAATITRADAAELLGVDQRTVTRAIIDGQLPSLRVGRRVLIPRVPLLARLGASEEPVLGGQGISA